MTSLHFVLILLAFILAVLAAFGVGGRVNLLAAALAMFFLDLLLSASGVK